MTLRFSQNADIFIKQTVDLYMQVMDSLLNALILDKSNNKKENRKKSTKQKAMSNAKIKEMNKPEIKEISEAEIKEMNEAEIEEESKPEIKGLSKAERLGEQFLRLDESSLITLLTFRVPTKRSIYNIIQILDKGLDKSISLYFVFQNYKTKIFYAVLNQKCFHHQFKMLECEDKKIRFVKQEITTIMALFLYMANIEFRQFEMFDRLSVIKKFLKKTRNPFAEAFYQNNAILISNYESRMKNISDSFTTYLKKCLQAQIFERRDAFISMQLERYGFKSLENQIHWPIQMTSQMQVEECPCFAFYMQIQYDTRCSTLEGPVWNEDFMEEDDERQ